MLAKGAVDTSDEENHARVDDNINFVFRLVGEYDRRGRQGRNFDTLFDDHLPFVYQVRDADI